MSQMEMPNTYDLVKNIKNDMHKSYHGIYLTDSQKNILDNHGIDVNKYSDIHSLMFDIEDYLEESTDESLEEVLSSLSEFNYYHNTNK